MIIGISGRAHSGKDTAAEVMISRFGFKRISFADPLKEFCSQAFGIDLSYFHDVDKKDSPFPTPINVTEKCLEILVTHLINAGCIVTQDHINELNSKGLGLSFVSPRNLLQTVGTDLGRTIFGNDIWINIFKNKIGAMSGHFIVTDIRFLNERQVIKDLNGYNFIVLRPSQIPISLDSHESELLGVSPEKIDVTILNDSTINSLQREIELWWTAKARSLGCY